MDLRHIGLLEHSVVLIITGLNVVMDYACIWLVDQVYTIGCPNVVTGVEFEEDQEGEEDEGDSGDIGGHKEVGGSRTEVVVEAVDVDVDSEEDGGDDHEDVVAHELLGDGVMEGGGPGRGGVELGEGVNQQLRGRQEQVDGDQTEQFAWKKNITS